MPQPQTPLADARACRPVPMAGWGVLWPLLIGLLVLCLPSYMDLAQHYWGSEDEAHGPIIVLLALYFAWTKRHAFLAVAAERAPRVGGGLIALALLFYLFGATQDILMIQLLAQQLLLIGLILLFAGYAALRVMWFPIFFLVFVIPVPAAVIDLITQPLKSWVSWATDEILYRAGYPIARQGVTISIGQYQLLVADACSGLRSLISLSALGVLFIYISARSSRLHRLLMLGSIVPLAMLANLVRVMALVLITYYLGDEAGQGYLHGTAGMVMFTAAMFGLIGWDSLLARLLPERRRPEARPG